MADSSHVTTYELVSMPLEVGGQGLAIGMIAKCSCGWTSEPVQIEIRAPTRVVVAAGLHRLGGV